MRSEYIAQLVCSFQGQWFCQRVAGFFSQAGHQQVQTLIAILCARPLELCDEFLF